MTDDVRDETTEATQAAAIDEDATEADDAVDDASDGLDEASDGVDEASDAVDEASDAVDEASDAVDETSDEDVSEDDSPKPARRWQRVWRVQVNVKPVWVFLILLILISGGVSAWLYVKQYRPAQQISPSVARAAVNAASDGTVALLSYSPDTLDKDFATARSHLAGDFLSYYDQFTQQFVAPAAKQKALKTTAHVMRAAVSELHPNSAVVLVFVDQSTTSKDSPNASMAASSVLVNLTLVDGKWLITKFTPV